MLSFILALLLAAPLRAASPQPPVTPASVIADAPAAAWIAIPPDQLLVMDLAPDAAGRARRVVIQLMPPPFGQGWVGNIRILARAHWWDGLSVNRVQDNYVAQWGDASEKKPLPAGLRTMAESEYAVRLDAARQREWQDQFDRVERERRNDPDNRQGDTPPPDAYTMFTGFIGGFPVGIEHEPTPDSVRTGASFTAAPVHCYGMVGVGRNLSPDTGTGAELYAVIGHAPRHLDRNIALVGRVVEGIEHLSALPRGTEALGFYKTAAERVAIRSVRLAGDLPPAERPRLQYLSTATADFARYTHTRANRRDAFFIRPAGGADVCNVPVPIRRAP